jgi:hypothetical protein
LAFDFPSPFNFFEESLTMIRTAMFWMVSLLVLLPFSVQAAFEVSQDDEGVTVTRDGQLLARYVMKSGNKPILWPMIGPHGEEVTRQYPMRDPLPTERADHPHHRSFWFTHGDVNGVSFWHEAENTGEIVHQEFLRVKGGEQAVISTSNAWITKEGEKLCEDVRTWTFSTDGDKWWFDFDTTVTATAEKVIFGDTKEGSCGVRVAGSVKVDAKQGGKIVNSNGEQDKEAWGKAAAWCDYYGPINGKTVGIAIMNHPSSLRFPTYWHVRTYGLFTANPFGLHDFIKSERHAGDLEMKAGDSFSLYYRVLVHQGDEKQGGVAEAFQAYAKLPKGPQAK